MDDDNEIAKFKWLLFAGAAFLIAGYYSYQELKYAVWGATAQATVSRTFETTKIRRFGRQDPYLGVEYTFTDEDRKLHNESDDVPVDWPVPEGQVTVQYLPGVDDSSRIEGNSSLFAVWVFLACCAWLGYTGYKLYREASEAVHGKRRRK